MRQHRFARVERSEDDGSEAATTKALKQLSAGSVIIGKAHDDENVSRMSALSIFSPRRVLGDVDGLPVQTAHR